MRYFECDYVRSDEFTFFEFCVYTVTKARCQDNSGGGIGGAGRDEKCYNDVLDLYRCYFIHVCVKDPGRARNLEDRKEVDHRRKERMGTVPLSEFSGHRESETRIEVVS